MIKYISVTDTAKIIRSELKSKFPNIKFSVRSKSYSMGASIDISYTGNVTRKQVESITNKFVGSTFDGMIDLKSYVTSEYNGETVHFGSDHVFVSRLFTLTEVQLFSEYLQNKYTWFDMLTGKQVEPKFEIKESEYSGAYINLINIASHGNQYFDNVVMRTMKDYESFEVFLKQDDIEEYNKRYGNVTETIEPTVTEFVNNGIEVVLERDWTWVLGIEREQKDLQEIVKSLGFRFSNKRKAWYNTNNVFTLAKETLKIE